MIRQNFHDNIILLQPLRLNYERERERVKSLRDFDLEFYNPNNRDTVFNGVFLFYQKVEKLKSNFYGSASMHQLIRKLLGKLNIAIVLFLAVLMTGGLGGATYVLAANTATQQASTAAATTISVVGKVADTAITTITFPQGAPGATVSNPYNDVDTVSDAQVLSATVSEPVVRLKNTSGGTLNVTLEITTWTNGVAASEDYELVVTSDTTVAVVDNVLSADGNAASVATGIGIAAGAYKALYLELVLSGVSGKSGTSTLTVLGETP